jgi:hypothetical protein
MNSIGASTDLNSFSLMSMKYLFPLYVVVGSAFIFYQPPGAFPSGRGEKLKGSPFHAFSPLEHETILMLDGNKEGIV